MKNLKHISKYKYNSGKLNLKNINVNRDIVFRQLGSGFKKR